jgi:hypothetical protein
MCRSAFDEIRDESECEKLESNGVLAANYTELTLHKTRIGA